MFTGIANPRPPVPTPGSITAVLTPITRPQLSSKGPPLFPGFMAASVWTSPVKEASLLWIDLSRALITPDVTVGPPTRPKGFPMA